MHTNTNLCILYIPKFLTHKALSNSYQHVHPSYNYELNWKETRTPEENPQSKKTFSLLGNSDIQDWESIYGLLNETY